VRVVVMLAALAFIIWCHKRNRVFWQAWLLSSILTPMLAILLMAGFHSPKYLYQVHNLPVEAVTVAVISAIVGAGFMFARRVEGASRGEDGEMDP